MGKKALNSEWVVCTLIKIFKRYVNWEGKRRV